MSDAASLPSSDHESSLGRRSRWRVLLWLGGIFLLLLSIIPISWAVIRWRTNQAIAAELERIRAAGEPASFEDVIASIPPLAPEKDCTQLYDEVFAIITSQGYQRQASPYPYIGELEDDSVPPPGEDWPGFEAAAKFIDAQAYTFMTLDKAAAMGGECRFPVTAEDLKGASIERASFKSHSAARLSQLRSVVAAHRLDVAEVMHSIRSLAGLVACLADETDTMSLLIRSGNNDAFNEQVVRLAGTGMLSDEQLAELQTVVRTFDYRRQLQLAFMTERLFIAREFAGTKEPIELGEEYDPFVERPPWWWRFTSHVDAWEYWRRMREVCDAAAEDDLAATLQRVKAVEGAVQTSVGGSELERQRYFCTIDAVESTLMTATAAVRSEASNRALDALLACERHRLAQGAYPQSLDEIAPSLLPAMPVDPFTGSPMRLRTMDEDIVVYSAGPDGQDDGGQLRSDDVRYRTHAWQREYEAAHALVPAESRSLQGTAAPAE